MNKFFPVFFSLLFVSLISLAQKSPIVTSDLLKMKTAGQIALSPNGKQAAFVVTTMVPDPEQDYKYQNHLWLANLGGDSVTTSQLTFGDRHDGSPVWSPDGSQIAFVRVDNDKPQIWILPLTGGEAHVLTHAKYGASQVQWSPDGNTIVFSSSIPEFAINGEPAWGYERPGRTWGDEPNYQLEPDSTVKASPDGNLEQVRAWLAKNASKDNPTVINRLDFLGENDLDNQITFSHLFSIQLADTTKVTQLTEGFMNYSSPSWSPDGQWLVCSMQSDSLHPDRNLKSILWKMKSDGSDGKELLSMENHRLYSPLYSPDGNLIAFGSSDTQEITYAQSEAGVVNADGTDARLLTEDFDRSLGNLNWTEDGKSLLFTASDHGYIPLFQLNLKSMETKKLLQQDLGISDYTLSGNQIALVATTVEHPYELYTTDTKGKNLTQISRLNDTWLGKKEISMPKKYTVESGGNTIDYWVMEPIGLKKGTKYPVVLEMHGGPSAMWGPGESSMWQEFQLLCSWGYGVVYANPRGSGGYGNPFRKANYQDWGHGPTADVLAALDQAMEQHEWMDSSQQFLTGGSYAGYLTAWIVSQEDRFKAAVAQRGVYELTFFFGEGNAWRLAPDHFGGYPWEEEAKKSMNANSPQTFVADIETPLLIIHSSKDLRTGVRQSELLYKSLKVMEKPVEYVRYPNEGHELSRSGNPLRRMDRLNRIVEFFERYVDHPSTPAANSQAE